MVNKKAKHQLKFKSTKTKLKVGRCLFKVAKKELKVVKMNNSKTLDKRSETAER